MLRFGFLGSAALLAAVVATPAMAAVAISGLVNSGQVAGGGVLTSGTVQDQNWFLNGAARPWNSASIHPAWLGVSSVSRWMTPASNGTATLNPTADGFYSFTLSFDLTGFQPGTAAFTGRFAADNEATAILLNGVQITQGGLGTFNRWTAFSADTGFVGGVNTLAFTLRNIRQASGNPAGLRVEFLTSSVEPALTGSSVPEPSSWAMLIAGFGLVGAAARRRAARHVA